VAAGKTASFGIKVDAESNADLAASSVEELRAQLLASTDAIKSYGATMRNLRGTTDEVKAAKEKLKTAVVAERDKVSAATLALGKHGIAAGEVKKKLAETKETVSLFSQALSHLVVPIGDVVTAFLALPRAVGDAAASLTRFIFESANMLRTQGLLREAATGSAANASAFGHQIDLLGRSVPQTRAELNELAVSLSRSLIGTRVSGQGIVDTFNAVARESAAMGDTAGKAIEDILTRGKRMGRLGLGVQELQGTGIQFTDVAAQLAKNLGISLAAAQNQLVMGRVNIDAGAKAIRNVIETRFGGINLKQMLDLDVMAKKFKDTLSHLTENVDLKPVQAGFEKLTAIFDDNTIAGRALKGLITDFGNAAGKVFEFATPHVVAFFNQIIIESQKLEIAFLKVRIWTQETFGVDLLAKLDDTSLAITVASTAFKGLAYSVLAVGAVVGAMGFAMYGFKEAIKDAYVYVQKLDWNALGSAIVDGITAGIKRVAMGPVIAIKDVADAISGAFATKHQIKSPSKLFEYYGKQDMAGYAQGVGASGAPSPGGAGITVRPEVSIKGTGGGNTVNVSLTLSFPNAKDAGQIQQAMQSPNLKASLTKLFEELNIGRGVPVRGGG
jgi:hypothetical protein